MSWSVRLDEGPGLRVTSGEAIKATIFGICIGAGIPAEKAEAAAQEGLLAARQYTERRRRDWRTLPLEYGVPVGDGRLAWVCSTDLPEDAAKRCDGLTSEGNRCGRSMNHTGEC